MAAIPFIFVASDHGRPVVTAASVLAQKEGVRTGMPLVDARALCANLQVLDEKPGRREKLLEGLAAWCIRYAPITAVNLPDGLLLEVTGCSHLWGGEHDYFKEIILRLQGSGYSVRGAIADTIGTAWAVARYGKRGKISPLIPLGKQAEALYPLPPAALRLSPTTLDTLYNFGIYRIEQFADLPKKALYRRFNKELVEQLEKALGTREELLTPLELPIPYHERLTSLEPILTATGIEIALRRLLDMLCTRLEKDGKGLRKAIFRAHRVDNQVEQVEIGTTSPSHRTGHLFALFKEKLPTITPAMGIELFTLDAPVVELAKPMQQLLWGGPAGLEDIHIAEWMDRVLDKLGPGSVRRYLPDQHHWPERSQKVAGSIQEQPEITWSRRQSRPIRLLSRPIPIQVTAPVPDYPPMNFRYNKRLHEVRKASGPERIEREWWLEDGEHRDYYWVENQHGRRYWIYRSGYYAEDTASKWFVHGVFG